MRITIHFKNESKKLPIEYRRVFMSYIKSILFSVGEERLYQRKSWRPFTFSVYLGDRPEVNGDEIKTGEIVSFHFSTGKNDLALKFLHGATKTRKSPFQYRQYLLTVEEIIVKPEPRIEANRIFIKTLGPAILTNPHADSSNFNEWFITPDHPNFSQILKERTESKYQFITGRSISVDLDVKPISFKNVVLKHYGPQKGFSGQFEISGHPDVIKFIYQYGMGVKTAQGFGMVEVIQ